MSALEPLCHLIGIESSLLTKEENILLEVELFAHVCDELKKFFEKEQKNYACSMQFTTEKESAMFEFRLVQLIILDILATDEYDMRGIARYTNTYEDVIEEVVTGRNPMPSVIFFRRLIDLHRSVRRDLYETIIRKITTKYLSAA